MRSTKPGALGAPGSFVTGLDQGGGEDRGAKRPNGPA
jgi:hypothetical protein